VGIILIARNSYPYLHLHTLSESDDQIESRINGLTVCWELFSPSIVVEEDAGNNDSHGDLVLLLLLTEVDELALLRCE
jgi:hypothetical protein